MGIPSIESVITSTQYNYHGHTYEIGMMVSTEDVKKMLKEYGEAVVEECAQQARVTTEGGYMYKRLEYVLDRESILKVKKQIV